MRTHGNLQICLTLASDKSAAAPLPSKDELRRSSGGAQAGLSSECEEEMDESDSPSLSDELAWLRVRAGGRVRVRARETSQGRGDGDS